MLIFAKTHFLWGFRVGTGPVFHANQRGGCAFLIQTLGPELRVHPHGGPQNPQGQELIFEHIS